MASKNALFFLNCLFLSWIYAADDNSNFVDPTDLLNFDPVKIRMRDKVNENVVELDGSNQGEPEPVKEDSLNNVPPYINKNNDHAAMREELFTKTESQCPEIKDLALKPIFKRFIMSLVHHIESRIDSSSVPVEFCMKMQASYNDLVLLKHCGTGAADNIHEVYDKLDKMILYATELPNEGTVYWLEKKLGLTSPILLLTIAVLLLGIISTKILIKVRITRASIAKGILFAFIISTGTTYIELYQQNVADQEKILTEKITERCPQLSDSIYSRLTNYLLSAVSFQDENCREYYEAVVVNPLFKVTLLEAGSLAFVKTLVSPLKIIGQGFKEFIVGFFKDLPVQFALYSVVIMVVNLIILPFLAFGYTIRIPFLLTLQPAIKPQIENHAHQVGQLEFDQKLQLQEAQEQICALQKEVKMFKEERKEQKSLEAVALTESKEPHIQANVQELEKSRSTFTYLYTPGVANISPAPTDEMPTPVPETFPFSNYNYKPNECNTLESVCHEQMLNPSEPKECQGQEKMFSANGDISCEIPQNGDGEANMESSDFELVGSTVIQDEGCEGEKLILNTNFFLTQEER